MQAGMVRGGRKGGQPFNPPYHAMIVRAIAQDVLKYRMKEIPGGVLHSVVCGKAALNAGKDMPDYIRVNKGAT